jgi:hypothetical protein
MDLGLSPDMQVVDFGGGRSRIRTYDLSHVRQNSLPLSTIYNYQLEKKTAPQTNPLQVIAGSRPQERNTVHLIPLAPRVDNRNWDTHKRLPDRL